MTDLTQQFNQRGVGKLPGHLGLVFTQVSPQEVRAELAVQPHTMAPNGFLHAGSVVTLADTACGYGCVANLPKEANGFTTIELKSNHLGTLVEGAIPCLATAQHLGRTTQVWDAVVRDEATGRELVLYRCTQMIL